MRAELGDTNYSHLETHRTEGPIEVVKEDKGSKVEHKYSLGKRIAIVAAKVLFVALLVMAGLAASYFLATAALSMIGAGVLIKGALYLGAAAGGAVASVTFPVIAKRSNMFRTTDSNKKDCLKLTFLSIARYGTYSILGALAVLTAPLTIPCAMFTGYSEAAKLLKRTVNMIPV